MDERRHWLLGLKAWKRGKPKDEHNVEHAERDEDVADHQARDGETATLFMAT
jgi:hypothetical protein